MTLLPILCAAVGAFVSPGFDFTNVVVHVDGAPGAVVSLVDSANAAVATDEPLVPASAYAYDVRADGVSAAEDSQADTVAEFWHALRLRKNSLMEQVRCRSFFARIDGIFSSKIQQPD